jgi:replicative DNA helicase
MPENFGHPNNIEAERSVLGSMLLDRDALSYAIEVLRPHSFYHNAHKEIFSAMLQISNGGSPVDLVTLSQELGRRGTLAGIGGIAFLVEIAQFVPTAANIRAYVKIVQDKYILRQLIEAGTAIIQQSQSEELEPNAVLQFAERAIYDISTRQSGSNSLVHIGEILPAAHERIERLDLLKGSIDGVPTGFTDLDKLTTGFHPGELIVLGARPSMGKTSIVMNMVEAAAGAKKTCAVFSLEMPREQIATRLICSAAQVDMQRVRLGLLSDEEWLRISTAIGPIGMMPLYIDDTSGITPSQLRTRCRRLKIETGKLDMIVLDYLQLMAADGRHESRQVEVGAISRALKGISQELKVPIVACAQLSRANAARQDKRPMLSDLRDSGSIEQDADVVMFLHREEYYDPETEKKNQAEVIISKQRNGALGTVTLAWNSQYTKFSNYGG